MFLLNFFEIVGQHMGENLIAHMVEAIVPYGIMDKVSACHAVRVVILSPCSFAGSRSHN